MPGRGLDVPRRRVATTRMPKASALVATSVPMPPRPTRPIVLVLISPMWFGANQASGGDVTHTSGIRFSTAKMAASTNSAIGMALAPREQVTIRPSNTPGVHRPLRSRSSAPTAHPGWPVRESPARCGRPAWRRRRSRPGWRLIGAPRTNSTSGATPATAPARSGNWQSNFNVVASRGWTGSRDIRGGPGLVER